MHYFGVPKLWSIRSKPLDPKWCLWVFQMISLTFGTKKMQNFYSSLNALFWGTKVVKHPFYSIGTKMMFASVSEHFTNLRHVKGAKLVFRSRMHYFRLPKLWSIHSSQCTQNDVWKCFGAFRKRSAGKRWKLVFRARMQYFGVPMLWSIHSSPLDPKWCLRVFQMISLTFSR
jgi:hypothetical protein